MCTGPHSFFPDSAGSARECTRPSRCFVPSGSAAARTGGCPAPTAFSPAGQPAEGRSLRRAAPGMEPDGPETRGLRIAEGKALGRQGHREAAGPAESGSWAATGTGAEPGTPAGRARADAGRTPAHGPACFSTASGCVSPTPQGRRCFCGLPARPGNSCRAGLQGQIADVHPRR